MTRHTAMAASWRQRGAASEHAIPFGLFTSTSYLTRLKVAKMAEHCFRRFPAWPVFHR